MIINTTILGSSQQQRKQMAREANKDTNQEKRQVVTSLQWDRHEDTMMGTAIIVKADILTQGKRL